MCRRLCVSLAVACLPAVSAALISLIALIALIALVVPAARADNLADDLDVLRKARIDTDSAGLLAFFKKRTLSEATEKKIAERILLLGDEAFTVREKATADLINVGAVARPLLTQALRHHDLEVSRRARRALEAIGPAEAETTVLLAAARVLADRKPAGAVDVLLNFLPNIEDVETAEELARISGQVALGKDGKPEAAVLLALSDKQWIKRYAAAEALSRIAGHRAAVRKLLKDDDTGLRRRVALTLLQVHDKEAVAALIGLLTASSSEDAGAAEELLTTLAGDNAPAPPADDSSAAREKYRQAWQRWWKENASKIELEKIDLDAVGKGCTLVGLMDARNMGKLQELDTAGRVRWTINDLRYPVHASKIRRDRVLVCESLTNRVSERDLKGKVLWEKSIPGQILSAQRLSNGNTFIVMRHLLLEVDKAGKEVKTIPRGAYDVLGAYRHKDGKTVLVTTNGTCVQMDKEGKETNSFSVGRLISINNLKIHFLPGGGVLVPDYRLSAIREYDASGKKVLEVALGTANRPSFVMRLPNGNTLVGVALRNRIIELDKTGKEVSNQPVDGRLLFLDRR